MSTQSKHSVSSRVGDVQAAWVVFSFALVSRLSLGPRSLWCVCGRIGGGGRRDLAEPHQAVELVDGILSNDDMVKADQGVPLTRLLQTREIGKDECSFSYPPKTGRRRRAPTYASPGLLVVVGTDSRNRHDSQCVSLYSRRCLAFGLRLKSLAPFIAHFARKSPSRSFGLGISSCHGYQHGAWHLPKRSYVEPVVKRTITN